MPPTTIVLFSYFPLIMEKLLELALEGAEPVAPERYQEVTDLLEECLELADATACLWMLVDGTPAPVLIVPHARRIHKDLMIWAEEEPEQWFTLELLEAQGAYALALFPNLEKSVERYKLGHLMHHEEILENESYQLIFAPLRFVSRPGKHCFGDLKHKIGDTVPVYLYDVENLDTQSVSELDEAVMYKVGNLKIVGSDTPGKQYLREAIRSSLE